MYLARLILISLLWLPLVAKATLKQVDSAHVLIEIFDSLRKSNLKLAEQHLHKAFDISLQAKDSNLLAQLADDLMGSLVFRSNDYKQAGVVYQKLLAVTDTSTNNWLKGRCYLEMGLYFGAIKDYPKSLDCRLRAMRLGLSTNDAYTITVASIDLAWVYGRIDEPEKSLPLLRKALPIAMNAKDYNSVCIIMSDLAGDLMEYYPDSAIYYINESIRLSHRVGSDHNLYSNYLFYAHILQDQGKIDSATYYYHKAAYHAGASTYLKGVGNAYHRLGKMQIDHGELYTAFQALDSALQYALASNRKDLLLRCYSDLYRAKALDKSYETSLRYLKLAECYKDSLYSKTKNKDIGKLQGKYAFEQAEIRKQRTMEIAQHKKGISLKRRHNIQYLFIIIVLIIAFGAVANIGKLHVQPKVIEGLIFFSFLMFFEFLLVIADPYIDNISGGAPGYKLLSNALLAGVIFPLHAWIEDKFKSKLTLNTKEIN